MESEEVEARITKMEDIVRKIEDRLLTSEISNKITFKWIGVIGLIIVGYFGYNNFYGISRQIDLAMKEDTAVKSREKIAELLKNSEIDYLKIKQIALTSSTITISGTCMRPRKLVRCLGASIDHLTWLDNADECRRAGYVVEGEIQVLAAC